MTGKVIQVYDANDTGIVYLGMDIILNIIENTPLLEYSKYDSHLT